MKTVRVGQKCVEGCRCGRHKPKPRQPLAPETKAKIAAKLRQRTADDPAWREHLSKIASERWERERAA